MKKTAVLATIALLSAFGVRSAAAADWSVRLFNIDDSMQVLVNGKLIRTCGLGQTCAQNLNSMVSGENTIVIRVRNGIRGFTYGYTLLKGTQVYHQDVCGWNDIAGCDQAELASGVVREFTFVVRR